MIIEPDAALYYVSFDTETGETAGLFRAAPEETAAEVQEKAKAFFEVEQFTAFRKMTR